MIHAYCVLCAVLWVGGVNAYNVGMSIVSMRLLHGHTFMLDSWMTTDSSIRAVICRCVACIDDVYSSIA